MGTIYKNMEFDAKYHLTDSIFPLIYQEYSQASEARQSELAEIGTCLECITTGSLLFKHLENPVDLVAVLEYIPSLRKKLNIGNMILAADYFYSIRWAFYFSQGLTISAKNSIKLGSDESIKKLSEIDEIEGKVSFEAKNGLFRFWSNVGNLTLDSCYLNIKRVIIRPRIEF